MGNFGTVANGGPVGDSSEVQIERRRIGDTEVFAILDGSAQYGDEAIDAFVPDRYRPLASTFPEEFSAGSWNFLVRVFLLRRDDMTVLFDAGIGAASTPLARAFAQGGRLMKALGALSIRADAVTHVVVSHHHDDHVGWLAAGKNAADPFPGAQILMSAATLEEGNLRGDPFYRKRVFSRLRDDPRVHLLTDDHPLTTGLTIRPAPGHTSGHIVLDLSGADQRILFVGDLLHFAFQLDADHPSGPFDEDPPAAQATRTALLRERPLTLASTHLPAAFTDLV